jgi:phospholipid/cholesterol/gamma-HCH transport system permease protein
VPRPTSIVGLGEHKALLMPQTPRFASERVGEAVRLALSGAWTAVGGHELETAADGLALSAATARRAIFDLSDVEQLDTAGAWLIERTRRRAMTQGAEVTVNHARSEYQLLLNEVHDRNLDAQPAARRHRVLEFLADIGAAVIFAGKDLLRGTSFLGELVSSTGNGLFHPARFRPISLVCHIETFAFRSVPIIALINFLVGCIVAQQGLFQARRYGAAIFTVDLIGILVLRELGVLLTSIMMAGRTGSAITAEIGSMKMREEVDALQVMGLEPVEVLVVPRILALMISLPMLTFLADMAAIFGGLLICWSYGSISPEIFMSRLQSAIALNTFLVGLIKAPFMALVIGLIATLEGMAVEGSAESLGRQVTASVVKSIFMVIVIDGLFAMFFASVRY